MTIETLDWICHKNNSENQSNNVDWVQKLDAENSKEELEQISKNVHFWGVTTYVLPLAKVDTLLQSEIKTNWFEHLCCLRKGEVTEAQVVSFAKYLLSLQCNRNEHIKVDGHWGLSEDLSNMTRDVRVDFVYEPTILAVACLSFIKFEHDSIWKTLPDADNALLKGIKFMYGRNLSSGGYSSADGLIRATHILAIGKFWSLSKSLKGRDWAFLRSKLKRIEKSLCDCIENPTTGWGSREPEVIKQALNVLEKDIDTELVLNWQSEWKPCV